MASFTTNTTKATTMASSSDFPTSKKTTNQTTTTTTTTTSSQFPNIGVSLDFLLSIAESPDLDTPMYQLARPDISPHDLSKMNNPSLRQLAKELRVHSHLNGTEEFALYEDTTITDQLWREVISNPPTTTTHINLCIVKPRTKGTNACYAVSVIRPKRPDWVSIPTDFLSHAWRYNFKDLVHATKSEAEERDRHRANEGLRPIAHERFYWNDIFVEDQNSTESKPEGYFFTAFRDAVTSIGRTVLILMPLKEAIPFTRAWCVWEMFCSVQDQNVELCVALPPSEKIELERMLRSEFDKIIHILTNVDMERSEAFLPSDRDEIHRIVREQCDGGFNGVNSVLCGGLRSWLARTALSLVDQVTKGEEDSETLVLMNQVGALLRDQGRLEEAAMLLRRAVAAGERDAGQVVVTLASIHHLGWTLMDQGKYEEGELFCRRALEGRVKVLSVEHEDTLESMNNLAALVEDLDQLEEAEELYRRALKGREKVLGSEHPDTLTSVNNLAMLLEDRGQLEEAEAMYRRSLAGSEKVLGVERPDTLTSVNNLAFLLQNGGELEEAEAMYRRGLAGSEKVLGLEHPDTVNARGNLGVLLIKMDDESGRWMVEQVLLALTSVPHSLPETHPWISKFRLAVGP